MKKLLAILLTGCMAFGMTACGGGAATEDAPDKTPEEMKAEYIQEQNIQIRTYVKAAACVRLSDLTASMPVMV